MVDHMAVKLILKYQNALKYLQMEDLPAKLYPVDLPIVPV